MSHEVDYSRRLREVSRPRRGRGRRRGVAVLLVLLLLSMTLALSYAMVRTQSTGAKVQRNAARSLSARQAAVTGMAIAMKKMSASSWAGVDSALSGSLGTYDSYRVTYTIGDPRLTSSSPDYADLPFRVTLLSTGSSIDPDSPQSIAVHKIRAVVRLIPRKLSPAPSDWDAMQQYTAYQTKKNTCRLEIPCRLEGPVRFQERLIFAVHYPDDNAWGPYLTGLNQMRLANQGDFRPLSGPVYYPKPMPGDKYGDALTGRLGVKVVDNPAKEAAADWTAATSPGTYRVFEGGPTYSMPVVSSTLANTTLQPDPLTNPLGIYYCTGSPQSVGDNVKVSGTLLCLGDLQVGGANVAVSPLNLPALYGSQSPVRLPVVSCQNFTIRSSARGSLTGLLAAFGRFTIEQGSETASFSMIGRFIASGFSVQERWEWDQIDYFEWDWYYDWFVWQLYSQNPVLYFPQWLAYLGRRPEPRLTLKPDPSPVVYSWFAPSSPVFVADPADGGLRWDLLDWTENPSG